MNTSIKTYSTRSNAKRALKAIGDEALKFEGKLILVTEESITIDLDHAKAVQDDAGKEGMDRTTCPECGSNEIFIGEGDSYGMVINEDSVIGCHHCDWVFRATKKAKKTKATGTGSKHQNVSTVVRPTTMVWEIAEKMKGAKRSEVLKACVEAGIAFNTARTQYQQWSMASRGIIK